MFDHVLNYLKTDRQALPDNLPKDKNSKFLKTIKYLGLDNTGLPAKTDSMSNVDLI